MDCAALERRCKLGPRLALRDLDEEAAVVRLESAREESGGEVGGHFVEVVAFDLVDNLVRVGRPVDGVLLERRLWSGRSKKTVVKQRTDRPA